MENFELRILTVQHLISKHMTVVITTTSEEFSHQK